MQILRNLTTNKTAITAGIICFMVFFKAVSGDFVNFDDNRFIVNNPGIRQFNLSMIYSALTEQFSDDYWAPLTWISFAVDYYFWELDPFGYHLTNILLHALNTSLVVLVADRIWNQGKESENIGPFGIRKTDTAINKFLYPITLLLAGLLWGLHPLRVESVAWATERKDVLYGMLALCSILCYLRDIQILNNTHNAGRRYYFYSLLLFMLALMAKPTSVFIPMLLVVADWFPFRRLQKGLIFKTLVEKIPFFILSALATIITVVKMSITSAPYSYDMLSFNDRVIISGHSIAEFFRLSLVPLGIHIFNTLAPVLANPSPAYVKTFIIAAFTCYCLYMIRKNRYFIVVWLAFLIPLLPTLPFFQVGIDVAYSTRHSYMPSVVPSITVAAMVAGTYKALYTGKTYNLCRLLTALTACVIVLNIAITQHLINSWKNSGALWSRAIKFNPVGRAYFQRAQYYSARGQYFAAAEDYLVAAGKAERAGNPEAFNYYAISGDMYNKSGKHEDAVAAFTMAIRLNPWPNYYYHRGLALQKLGRQNEASEDFRISGNDKRNIMFLEVP